MEALRLHHLGIACHDIERAVSDFEATVGVAARGPVIHDRQQDAHVCLVTLADGSRFELVSGPRVEGLVRKGLTYYHVCYEVDDLDKAVSELLTRRCRLVSAPAEAPLFDGRRVAFLHSRLGLFELLESR